MTMIRLKRSVLCLVLGLNLVHHTIKAQPNPCNCDLVDSSCLINCELNPLIIKQELNQFESSKFLVYPNPISNQLKIQSSPNNLLDEIEMYSINGELLWKRDGLKCDSYALNEISAYVKGSLYMKSITLNIIFKSC